VLAAGLALVLLPALVPAASTEADPLASTGSVPEPWRSALRFDFNRASDEFARLHAASPDDHRIAIARASSLLARQPRTQANILAARGLLERVATGAPSESDEAIAARLLVARIAESHQQPSRPEEARALYEALLRDHAGHRIADQAAVHLALLTAYPLPPASPLDPAEVQTCIEALRARAGSPPARRDLHALQGNLLLRAGDEAGALPHFLAARAIGFRQAERNADTDLTIGNLARALGDNDLAARHYQSFLRDRPRDARASTVRRYLVEIGGSVEPSAPPPAARSAGAFAHPHADRT
jgi:tetratricopeptide (TPR) repeat protein